MFVQTKGHTRLSRVHNVHARFKRIYRIRDLKFYLQMKTVVLFQPKNKQFHAGVFFCFV